MNEPHGPDVTSDHIASLPADALRTTDPVRGSASAAGSHPGAAAPPGFDLLDEVGRGGMGVVFRARDFVLGREVAVKLLQDRFPADGAAAQRFLGEARI